MSFVIENNCLVKVINPSEVITVPEGVEKINGSAFSMINCKTVNLPNSLKTIEPLGFSFCSVENINIPDNTNLFHDSFFECSNLSNVIISTKKFEKIKPNIKKYFGCDSPFVNKRC